MSNTSSLFNKKILQKAITDSFVKLNPASLIKNPVIFMVEIGALLTTLILFQDSSGFNIQIAIWLWFTVLFANFSEAIAEGRGKAQAESLRKTKSDVLARKIVGKNEVQIKSSDLRIGDVVVCETGNIIPSDGEVIEGASTVDESAITGESAPVVRESGGDRSAVTGGTVVLSDRILIKISVNPGGGFIDKMIALVEGAKRKKTPNEIALSILLSGLSIVFLLAVVTLKTFIQYSETASNYTGSSVVTIPILIALLVCLIPTTIGGLLSAIGISGMDRLITKNVIATSGRAVEAAGDIDTLILDKTGTITLGNRMASQFVAVNGVDEKRLADVAQLSSLSDETPEGRSITILAKEKYGLRSRDLTTLEAKFIPFSAQTRMSGVDIIENNVKRIIRKGAIDSIKKYVESEGNTFPKELQDIVENIAKKGSTPLVVVENYQALGVIELKDIVKGGIKERFAQLRTMGIKTIMVTGDNPLTAAAIAAESGVDDFIAEARPEDKLARIREEQEKGHMVGMIGDGTNDAPALAQADVGIAMNTGTQAAREAGNMVDLDSNPTKLIDVVEVGKQLLMTRGALTTFSIANDVAKYFAIIPAITTSLYASNNTYPLSALNIMNLATPQSAILSAVIFNAIVIIMLVPLALKGVKYMPIGASEVLKRNIFIYGLGGLISPFIAIKLIDILVTALKLV
ncbi:MAG: potassium-transporting ATPase subunit KdpB [Cyanobacteriota bacterium]